MDISRQLDLREFIASKHILQKILKDVLQAEWSWKHEGVRKKQPEKKV